MRHSLRVSILLGLLSIALHAQYVTARLFTRPSRTAAYLPAFETLVSAGHVAVAPDGSVYLTSLGSIDIFRINPDGLLEPFAGSGSAIVAPGLVAGALQVIVRLPDDLLTGYYAIELRVGDAISGPALVFTKARQEYVWATFDLRRIDGSPLPVSG